MKKKIIISAIIFTLIFLLCFLYIIFTIEQGTNRLDNLITLHQVEILREHLLLQVKKVQSDLQVKNTRYARSIETVVNNVRNMEALADTCLDCHHSDEMVTQFQKLKKDIVLYKNSISRLLTVRANIRRLATEEDKAYQIGEHLLEMVNDMISIASSKLESKTQEELQNIADTKNILFILLAIGPLSIIGTAVFVIKGITNPLNKLHEATKKLKQGNLEFKVEGLNNEFGAVADSFNEMSDALKSSMLKIRESEERYTEASKATKLGHWERDLVHKSGFWSKETYNIFGVDPNTFEPTFDNFISLIHPDDRQSIVDSLNPSLRTRKTLSHQYRIICTDGKEKIVESKSRYKFSENKESTVMVGTIQDITERKKNEDALIRAHIMFTTVLDSIDSMIYVSDIETDEILYMNYQAKDVLGDLEGKSRKHALKSYCTIDKIITPDRQPQSKTYIYESHDAERNLWYEIRVRGIEWVDGRVVRMEIAHDFTERKNATDRSKEYLEFLETLMNTIPLPIFYKNEEGRYTGCNRAFEEFVGFSKGDLLGKTVYDMGPEELADKYYIKDKELFDNPGEQIYEWKVKRSNGEKRDVILYKATFMDANNKVAGLVGTILDITDRKLMETKLRRAEQMQLVGEWAAGLAHEIKNSLAGIKISVEILAEEQDLPKEDQVAIWKAIDEIKRIEFLLKSLLNFAKPPDLHLLVTDLNHILDHTIDFSMKQRASVSEDRSKITVRRNFDKNLPETMCDSLQMKQVFMNILLNARDAMEEGGTLNARTFYKKEDNTVLVEISDTGNGISEQLINKIFTPFFTTKSKGTGLGLAITKRIINQHGGTIKVENKPGGGAIFSIVIPVKTTPPGNEVQ